MTNWQTKTIGELVEYEQPNKYLVKSTDYITEGIPVLTANKAFVLGYTEEKDGIYAASKDSPVIIFDDFTTDNKYVDFNFKVKSSAIKILTAESNEALLRFVHGAMQLINTEITEHKRRFISEYQFHPVDTPSLKEQERIVGVLEVWDDYIEKLEQKIALKEQLKKGLMQDLFNGKRRVNSSDSKWEYTTLSNFASKSKNAIVDGPFGSQMKLSEFTSTGVPVIEMHHLKNTFIEKLSLTRFVSEDKFKRDLSRSGVCGGDIIISKTGSLGYLGLMPGGESAVITSRLAKITIDQQMADRQFVFQYLKYMKMIGYWERIGQGGTMKILSIDNFKKMPIPNISKKEQEKLASILDLADKEIKALDDKRSRLVDQKKYILKNLITGTIRTPETLKPKGEAT